MTIDFKEYKFKVIVRFLSLAFILCSNADLSLAKNKMSGSGSSIYLATGDGILLSNDGGLNFLKKSTGRNTFAVFGWKNKIYEGTGFGLGISSDGGLTFSKAVPSIRHVYLPSDNRKPKVTSLTR